MGWNFTYGLCSHFRGHILTATIQGQIRNRLYISYIYRYIYLFFREKLTESGWYCAFANVAIMEIETRAKSSRDRSLPMPVKRRRTLATWAYKFFFKCVFLEEFWLYIDLVWVTLVNNFDTRIWSLSILLCSENTPMDKIELTKPRASLQ